MIYSMETLFQQMFFLKTLGAAMAFNKFNVILSKQASSDISCIYEYISLTLCIGYAMWTPEKTKLELATFMLR